MKLDRSKPFGIFFDGPLSYHGQDGKLFDKGTDEEVVTTSATQKPPKSPEDDSAASSDDSSQPSAGKATCNQCGKEFVLPADSTARKLALGRLRAHLRKEHNIKMEAEK